MYPARTNSLWLATSASAGASRRVGIKSCDQRCMVMVSNRERILDCKRWLVTCGAGALARESQEQPRRVPHSSRSLRAMSGCWPPIPLVILSGAVTSRHEGFNPLLSEGQRVSDAGEHHFELYRLRRWRVLPAWTAEAALPTRDGRTTQPGASGFPCPVFALRRKISGIRRRCGSAPATGRR